MAGRLVRDDVAASLAKSSLRSIAGFSTTFATLPRRRGAGARVSLIEEGPTKQVRMANLAIVGSHSTNGVARFTPSCCARRRSRTWPKLFPERFNNKTNGVTPRRWLLVANPALARMITRNDRRWLDHRSQRAAKAQSRWPTTRLSTTIPRGQAQRENAVCRLAQEGRTGQTVDPDTIFDCQIKRIHEYKRQLLNALRIVVLYNRLRQNPGLDFAAADISFCRQGGARLRSRQGHHQIYQQPGRIPSTAIPTIRGRIKVLFLPDYDATLAERLIPASDVSNQISTAGYEASGTSNMKFMMNGALTRRHAGRRNDRNGRRGRRRKLLPVRTHGRTGLEQPQLVQPALAL